MKNFRLIIIKSLLFCFIFILHGCASKNLSSESFQKSIYDIMGWHDTEVEDTSKYESMPFEKVINRTFAEDIGNKQFKFTATFKGTVPNPGSYKSVEDHINIKLCDINKIDVCSDLIIIKKDKANIAFDLNNNQIIEAYGFLPKMDGIRMGNGAAVNFSQLGTSSPYSFVRVISMKPISNTNSVSKTIPNSLTTSDISKKTAKPQQEALSQSMSIQQVQQRLKELGYKISYVDGKLGNRTTEAIRKYQSDNALPVTGVVDSATMNKLR